MDKSLKIGSILYAEDEKNIQDELKEVLQDYCENLYLADDGIQALKEYKNNSIDIIITDIKMPNMDGIEMSKKIKEINPEQSIIFTTAFSDTTFFQEAIELQVDGYILKPVDLDLLEKKIVDTIKYIKLKEDLEVKEQMLIEQSKLAAMGEMIGNIAHQWRQPLSVITTSASGFLLKLELNGDIDKEFLLKYSQEIVDQANYLSQTIDNFREFFKPIDKLTSYKLKEFLEECVELVSAAFDNNYIKVVKDIEAEINTYGDSKQLAQALINILNNAKDALKDVQTLQKKLVFIVSAKKDDKNLTIEIKDNAGGIPEDIIDKIFEPYFTTKQKSQGTGLGLYITHTIITKNLNGKVYATNDEYEFEGERYKGAKFTIILPLDTNLTT